MPNNETQTSTDSTHDQEAEHHRDARAWKIERLNRLETATPGRLPHPEGDPTEPEPIGTPVVNTDPDGEPWSDLPGPRLPHRGNRRS